MSEPSKILTAEQYTARLVTLAQTDPLDVERINRQMVPISRHDAALRELVGELAEALAAEAADGCGYPSDHPTMRLIFRAKEATRG